MATVSETIKTRRSANNFIEGTPLSETSVNEIFELMPLVPSCFNLQHAKYHVVLDQDKKSEVYEAAGRQHKIKTASGVIMVTGDKHAYQDVERIYQGTLMLGILQQFEFNKLVGDVKGLYEGRGESFMHDEAIRNASLSAMQFMLLAKEKGWDTCPMVYFDSAKISEILDLPESEVPVLMITIGKMDQSSDRVRGFRKPVNEIMKIY